jgi:uncharacterized membrane protein (UPF0127 family)
MPLTLYNVTRQTTLADRCRYADTVFKRMIGLLNRSGLDDGEALLLDRCYGIHTYFMRFPIDVLFLDHGYTVLRAVEALPPFRTSVFKKAVFVLELPAGKIKKTATQVGDQIQVRTGSAGDAAESHRPSSATR